MGESVSFSRFVGIEISEDNNLLKTLNALGMKHYIHNSPMGESPSWLIAPNARSVCQMSYSRWDGHGGGAEDFDFHADPFDKKMQREAINYDTEILQDYIRMMDNHNINHGDIVHVLGWTDTWRNDHPTVPIVYSLFTNIVSYGPWVVGGEDHPDCVVIDSWWEPWVVPATELIELPYGKETCKGKPVIPIRSKEESTKIWDEHRDAECKKYNVKRII